MSDPTQCSFCAKPRSEVRQLVAGSGVAICDECISLCEQIIAEEQPPPLPAQTPNPAVLLDARVVGQEAAKRAVLALLRERAVRAMHAVPGRAARVLIVGPTGSGKTTLARAACECAAPRSCLYDAGRLSESGRIGDS